MLAAAVLSLAAVPSAAETVEIRSAADWDNFARRVNNGELSLSAILVQDVTLTEDSIRCGNSSTRHYAGDFNGNGKTLTVAFKVFGAEGAAPFAYVSGCTVHDLHVAGTIKTDGKFAGGIAGAVYAGGITIERCRVSATITSSVNGDASSGGLVGATLYNGYRNAKISDCLFDGSLLGSTAHSSGGLVGWRYSAFEFDISNSLFAPKNVTFGTDGGSATLMRGGFKYASDNSNNYYTRSFGDVQGTDASGMTPQALATALGPNWKVENGAAVPALVVSDEFRSAAVAFAYQGVLRDAQGHALAEKRHRIEFRIYDQATGGAPHWGRASNVLLDDDGLFNVEIADEVGDVIDGIPGVGLSSVLAANAGTTLYIGLTVVGSNGEIAPRQKLLAAPYAAYAADVAAARGDVAVSNTLHAASANVTDTCAAAAAAVQGSVTVGGDLTVGGALSGCGTIPLGGIITWSGAANAIPYGWALCDGQTSNGRRTPDLRERFIVGAGGSYGVGDTGGAKEVALTVAQMPSHKHALYGRSSGYALAHNNSHEVITYANKDWGSWSEKINDSESAGGGQAHENRPPFYALCYIMRVR